MATDQEIRDAGFKYIPQQKWLLNPFEIPTSEEPVVDQGIVNTNAFVGSGGENNFNPAGNAFGYGTAVQPGDKSVITGSSPIFSADVVTDFGTTLKDPTDYRGHSGYYNSLNYTGGLPGDIQQKGPGRYFQYEFTRPDADGNLVNAVTGKPATGEFYKDYTLQPEKELPSWMKAGLAFLPGGTFAVNYLENKMNPGMTGMTAAEIDEAYGGGEGGATYGIGGLSDTQKQYYDALAGQDMLFSGQQGFKTLTGKNFTGKGYVEGQLDIYNDFLNDEFKDMTEEEINAAIAKQKQNKKGQWKWKKMKESKAIYDANQNQIKKATAENIIDPTGPSNAPGGTPGGSPDNWKGTTYDNSAGDFRTAGGQNVNQDWSDPTDFSQSSDAELWADGGRVGYFYGGRVNFKNGGLASIL